jgi:hypothetical protein
MNTARNWGKVRNTYAWRLRRRSQGSARARVGFPLCLLPLVFRRRRGSFGVLNRAL